MYKINGLKVYVSSDMVDPVDTVVKRTWRERLLSMPWAPWKATKTVRTYVPLKTALTTPNGMTFMHPETLRNLIEHTKAKP